MLYEDRFGNILTKEDVLDLSRFEVEDLKVTVLDLYR